MGINDKIQQEKLEYIDLENLPDILPLDHAVGIYSALKSLGNDWSAEEFALQVLYSGIRAFEKSDTDGMLRPVADIQDQFRKYGEAEAFSGELYSLDDVLLRFKYSKSELSKFTPEYRYISFNKASEIAAKLTGDIEKAERFLMGSLKCGEIYAYHPFYGTVTPELSLGGERWRSGCFEEWHLYRLLANEFGEIVTAETISSDEANSQADTTSNERKSSAAIESSNVIHSTTTQEKDTHVTPKQIRLIFDKLSDVQWRGHFSREKTNGLSKARQGKPRKPTYMQNGVADWLKKMALYTEAEIQLAIKKYSEPQQDIIKANKSGQNKRSFGDELYTLGKKK